MANELNVFAVDADGAPSWTMSVPVVRRRLFRRVVDLEEREWLETFGDADEDDQVDWLFGQPEGVRWLGQSFRHEYVVIEDLEERIVAHLDDPVLAADLTQDEGVSRVPPRGGRVARMLAQGAWRVFDRDEMRRLAAAVRAALAADPAWAEDVTTFAPDWRALADDLETADEDLFVWAFWH